MDKQQAFEVFEGAMLSDAGLGLHHHRGAYFDMALSTKPLPIDWLEHVKIALEVLGTEACSGHPKVLKSISKGKPYTYCRLSTTTSSFLDSQYPRWYKNGSKGVPGDLLLTHVSLANWFMGDGGSSWMKSRYVIVRFHTEAFNKEDNMQLVDGLNDLGVSINVGHRKTQGGQPYLYTGNSIEVMKLMDMIEPHIVPSFGYKIKRPDNGKVRRSFTG